MPPPNTRSAVDALLKLRGVALAAVLPCGRARRRRARERDERRRDRPQPVIRSDPPSAGRDATVRAGVREWTAAGGDTLTD